jgi:tetratricopeptide (TPR) repeat protein
MSTDQEIEAHLNALEQQFMQALALKEKGQGDKALALLESILRVEPRLPEPHLEMARIYLERERLEEAEAEAREAVGLLERGGQWLEDIPEAIMQALAWALLGEILKQRAASDDVVFGEADVFRALIAESRAAFAKAVELDPEDLASAVTAAELGGEEEEEDEDDDLPDA